MFLAYLLMGSTRTPMTLGSAAAALFIVFVIVSLPHEEDDDDDDDPWAFRRY